MRLLLITGILLAISWAANAAGTDVYRWTDEKGVTHYSDKPPAETRFERVNVRTGTASSMDEATPETDKKSDAAADENVQAERCRVARQNLQAVLSGVAVIAGDDGEHRPLTEEEKQAQIEYNEGVIRSDCNEG